MREGWKEVELGSICKVKGGKRLPKGHELQLELTKHPYIRARDIKNGNINFDQPVYINDLTFEKISKYIVNTGDVIITIVGANIGDIAYVTSRFDGASLTENAVKLISISSKIDSKFLKYALVPDYMKNYFQTVASGAAQDKLGLYKINKIKIYLPSLPTQRKIATILSAYDDLIENNLKRIKLLEEKAQLTYEEWFVKMRFPGFETAKFDTVTGLPEGWEKKTIGDICKASGGGTPSRALDDYWIDGNITWYSPTDLSKANSLCILDSSQKITELGLKKSSARLLDTNSFMMTSRATIGLFALINKPFTTNQGFINVTPINEFEKEYLLYNFKYRVEEFKGHATGATFPELSKSKFNALDIIWPLEFFLKQFNKITSVLHTQLFNLTEQNRLLKEARDILLPRLMSGMIDVDTLSKQVVEEMETLKST